MDALLSKIGEVLASHGLAGVVIMFLGYLYAKRLEYSDSVQEKRIQEQREALKIMSASIDAVEANTEAIQSLSNLMRTDRKGA